MIGTAKKSTRDGIVYLYIMLAFLSSLSSQNISIRQSIFEFPGICYQTTFTLIIRNDESVDWTQNVLNVQLPCGFKYVPGSITNASESDISNLSLPKFSIGNLAKNTERSYTFKAIPDCTAYDCLNMGMTFRNEYSIVSAQGQKTIISDNYNVETPNLIITTINNPFLEGVVGTETERKITVKNTRLGRVTRFQFQDTFNPDLAISIVEGTLVLSEQDKIIVELGPEDFKKIGNLDSLFDFNEEIIITEKITSGGCVLTTNSVQSDLSISWGCNQNFCQTNSAKATFRIIPKEDTGDKFTFSAQVRNPSCYYPGNAEQTLTVQVAPSISDLYGVKMAIEHPVLGRNILVGSVSVPEGFDVEYSGLSTNECMEEIAKKVIISRDTLEGSDQVYTFDIQFISSFCEKNGCNPSPLLWKTSYEYEKECSQPDDIKHTGTFNATSQNPNVIKSDMTVLVNGSVVDGKAGALRYTINSAALKNPIGELRIKFQIPAFLQIIATNYSIGTKIPVVDEVVMGRTRMITLTYSLPFPFENPQLNIPFIANCSDVSLLPCKDSIQTTCPDLCFVATNNEIVLADAWIVLDPDCSLDGSLMTCAEAGFMSECTNGYCIEELKGYVNFDVNMKRLTLGLPDKNGDHIPDEDGLYDESLLNRSTVFLGDTFVVNVLGDVIIDNPTEPLDHAVIQIKHTKINSQSNVGPDIIQNGITAISNQLVLYDKSTQQRYYLEDIPYVFLNLQYTYDISPDYLRSLYPVIPTDFTFEHGDSISLSVFKVFNRNFPTPFVGWNGHDLSFDYAAKIALTQDEINPDNDYLACGCPEFPAVFIGYNAWSQTVIPGVAQCPGQTNISSILCNYGYPFPSPGEIKFYQRPKGFRIGKVTGIKFDSLAVSTGIFPEKIYKSFTETDDAYYIDISDFTKYKNFRAGLRFWLYRTSEECISQPIPPTFCELLFEQAPTTSDYISDKVSYTLQNVVTVPDMNLELPQKEFTALQATIEYPLKLINKVNSQVRNIFIRPVYDPQSFSDVSIKISTLPVSYPDINGYFVLGNLLPNETRNLIFEAKGKQCGRNRIIFEYGYDCSVYNNPAEEPCFIKSDTVYIDFQNGELELIAQIEDKTLVLCDTINETTFTVYNGGLGNVFHLKPSVFIPRGMEIMEGSCTITYPSQSGNSIQIPEPTLISGRWYQWDLASFWALHAAEGLAAVSLSPDNAFDISYRNRTDCQFISGSQERYSISGEQVCGLVSNQISKAGPVLKIDNIPADIDIMISASAPDILYCSQEESIHIQYDNGHPDDSQLFVHLPQGVEVVSGSFTGNLPVIEPVTSNGVLEWFVPQGQTSVDVTFTVRAADTTACVSDFIEVSTSRAVNLFCQSDQSFCDIQNTTGKVILPVLIQKQTVFIDTLKLSKHMDSTHYVLHAVVRFETGNMPVFGNLVYDRDQNGILDQQDTILQVVTITPGMNLPDLIQLNIPIDPNKISDFCHIWLAFGDSNCLCNLSKRQVSPIIEFQFDTLALCWNEGIELGVGERPQRTYQWNSQLGLACTQCGLALFNLPNELDNQVSRYEKLLRETDLVSGCIQDYHYVLDVYPRQKIITPSEPVCIGDTLLLVATSFSTGYEWVGDGIFNIDQNQASVSTDSASWVYVTMTDSLGCLETDSFFIDVRQTPPVSFINDGRFCFGQEAIVGYVPQSGIQYSWIDPFMLLLDTMSEISGLLNTDEGFVYVQVENSGCSRLDSLSISFYQGVTVTGIQDSFIVCQGDSLTIELNGANQYEWLDSNFGTCQNDSCSSLLVITSTLGILTTEVVGITAEGCRDTFPIRILSVSETEENITKQSICQGDSILFMGNVIREAGLYCDTMSTGACQYVQCLEVSIMAPPPTTLTENICPGDTLIINGNTYTEAGQYEWTVQSAQGCDSLIILQVNLLPGPVITLPQNVEIIEGEFTTVTLPDQFTYVWSPGTGLNCTTCSLVTIEGIEGITYTITVTDITGCYTVYQLPISVQEVCKPETMTIPNAFTPNGDQINDVFTIPELKICEINITIFNRWGNIVYQQSPFDNAWDGQSSNGADLPSGTYYYLIETLDSAVKRTGMIDLRRQ